MIFLEPPELELQHDENRWWFRFYEFDGSNEHNESNGTRNIPFHPEPARIPLESNDRAIGLLSGTKRHKRNERLQTPSKLVLGQGGYESDYRKGCSQDQTDSPHYLFLFDFSLTVDGLEKTSIA